jgi:long-chain-fatty-acid--CoA ligase ACSBG
MFYINHKSQFAASLKAKGAETTGLKRKIVDWAKGKAVENFVNHQNGGSGETPFMYGIAQFLLNKIKVKVGLDKCKFASTAAAPIHRDVLNFFGAISIPIMEVYGMSESCGPQTITRPMGSAHLVGSTGPSMVGTELKIMHDASRDKAGEGEICFRGRHIMMGYLGNEQKTVESIDADGWLHSGDVGRVDENGMLFITGRIKELLITAGGENIPPVPIEEDIKAAAPAISNLVVIGDKKKYLTALVTLTTTPNGDGTFSDELTGDALGVNPQVKTASAAVDDAAFKAYVQKGIDHYNSHAISNAAKIQYFSILPNDFSIPGGELGPTLKLRRSKVVEKYESVIEAMYKK